MVGKKEVEVEGAVSWDSQQAHHSLDQGFHLDVISNHLGGGIDYFDFGEAMPKICLAILRDQPCNGERKPCIGIASDDGLLATH